MKKYIENYHYMSLIFALASISPEINIIRDKNGFGLAQKTDYHIYSNDLAVDYTINFYTYSTDEKPYQKELYGLANYVKANNPYLKLNDPVTNDKELFSTLALLSNAYNHWTRAKLRLCSEPEQNEILTKTLSPLTTTCDWIDNINDTFIPRCREHIALLTATQLMYKEFLSLGQTNERKIKQCINQTLFALNFAPEDVMNMYIESSGYPAIDDSSFGSNLPS